MKPAKIFFACLTAAAAFAAAAVIFYNKDYEVKAVKINATPYQPHISFSGVLEYDESENEIFAVIQVGEENISKINVGQKASITGSGFPDKKYEAYVIKIGKNAKKTTVGGNKIVAVDVYLKIKKQDDFLKSGFTAKVEIYTDDEKSICVAPYNSVLQDKNGEYVFVCKNGKAVKTYIKTGVELDGGYEVLSGIQEKDTVILSPESVNDGDTIFEEN